MSHMKISNDPLVDSGNWLESSNEPLADSGVVRTSIRRHPHEGPKDRGHNKVAAVEVREDHAERAPRARLTARE